MRGLGSTGVWGQHAEGPAWGEGEGRAGLPEAEYHVGPGPGQKDARPNVDGPGRGLPPWGGGCHGLCAQCLPQGEGCLEPAFSHGLGGTGLLGDCGHHRL